MTTITTADATAANVPQWSMGDRLRKARETAGIDQRDFADQIGVSRQTITNAEKGHRKVRRIVLMQWSMATGVPLVWLETGQAPAVKPGPDDGWCAARDSNPEPAD